jgi:hypothetical protein
MCHEPANFSCRETGSGMNAIRTKSSRWTGWSFLGLVALACFSSLTSCLGGSSTDTGNPEFVTEIYGPDGLVEFKGLLAFYKSDGMPRLVAPGTDALAEEPWADLGPVRGDAKHLSFTWKDIEKVLIEQESIRLGNLAKVAAGPYPEFNVFIQDLNGLSAAVAKLYYDPNALIFKNEEGEKADTLRLTLKPTHSLTAEILTEDLDEAPCLVFVGGSPYSAWVDGGMFTLTDIPDLGSLPIRLVTQNGTVFELNPTDEEGQFIPGETLGTLNLPPLSGLPPRMSAPTFLPTDTLFGDSIEVRLLTKPGAAIHYTLDGSVPDESSPYYKEPLTLTVTTTVRAMAVKLGYRSSEISSRTYVRDGSANLLPPTCSPAGGPFVDSVAVTLTHPLPGVELRYTLNGSAPDEESPLFEGELFLKVSTLLQVRAFHPGYQPSTTLSVTYLKAGDSLPGTPIFNPNDRAFVGSLEVLVELPEGTPEGAEIRYTTDGSNPDRNSTLYEGPLTLETSTSIRAATFLLDGPPSVIAVRQYVRLDDT